MDRRHPALAALAAVAALACSDPIDPAPFRARAPATPLGREPCARQEPLRRALFGDLHVHTALSSDAWNYDVEVRPREAYGYAFGEAIGLPPNDADAVRRALVDRRARSLKCHILPPSENIQCTDRRIAITSSK